MSGRKFTLIKPTTRGERMPIEDFIENYKRIEEGISDSLTAEQIKAGDGMLIEQDEDGNLTFSSVSANTTFISTAQNHTGDMPAGTSIIYPDLYNKIHNLTSTVDHFQPILVMGGSVLTLGVEYQLTQPWQVTLLTDMKFLDVYTSQLHILYSEDSLDKISTIISSELNTIKTTVAENKTLVTQAVKDIEDIKKVYTKKGNINIPLSSFVGTPLTYTLDLTKTIYENITIGYGEEGAHENLVLYIKYADTITPHKVNVRLESNLTTSCIIYVQTENYTMNWPDTNQAFAIQIGDEMSTIQFEVTENRTIQLFEKTMIYKPHIKSVISGFSAVTGTLADKVLPMHNIGGTPGQLIVASSGDLFTIQGMGMTERTKLTLPKISGYFGRREHKLRVRAEFSYNTPTNPNAKEVFAVYMKKSDGTQIGTMVWNIITDTPSARIDNDTRFLELDIPDGEIIEFYIDPITTDTIKNYNPSLEIHVTRF